MKPTDLRSTPRPPRTFEMHEQEWVESGTAQRPRMPLWLVASAVLAAVTAAFLVVFAVLAALFTGGLLAARRRFIDATASLRERFSAALRR